jgi:large subunit ribosomal protein L18
MSRIKNKLINTIRRKAKVRAKISGTSKRPRLSVFRSNTSIFLQAIDDVSGKTLVSAHSREVKNVKSTAKDMCKKEFELGKLLAKKANDKKINEVVFDRSGNKYHGRVKAVADGAREGGLKF